MRNDDQPWAPERAARRRLDTLIDRAARSLTDAEPPARLRAAVRERIERAAAVDGGGRLFTGRLAWTAYATAAIVLLIVTLGRDAPPGGERPSARPPMASAGPADPRPVPAVPPPMVPEAPAPRAARRSAAAEPVREAVDAAIDPPIDGPLVIERMAIEPLEPEPLAMEFVEVPMPLRAESVVIEPISTE